MNQDFAAPTEQNISILGQGYGLESRIEKLRSESSSSNLSDAERSGKRNTSKKRRPSFILSSMIQMTGMIQTMEPEPQTPVRDSRSSTSKRWRESKSPRKFTFSSPEDYMQYKRNSMSNLTKEKRPEQKVEKKEETVIETEVEIKGQKEVEKKASITPQTKKKNWRDKYRSGRRYTFKSPEEYIEYARSKSFSSLSVDHLSIDNSEEFVLKKAKKRLTTSTEFALSSAEFGENLDATADVTIEQIPDDIEANDEGANEERERERNSNSNKRKRRNRKKRGCCKKNAGPLCRKLTFSEIWRLLLLWVVIVAIALVFILRADEFSSGAQIGTTNTTNTGCLCPSGSIIDKPELEVFLGDFSCGLDEPVIVKTCGEVEELLTESSRCENHDESCFNFEEAVNQCCVPETDEILEKQLSQTKQAEDHFRVNGH